MNHLAANAMSFLTVVVEMTMTKMQKSANHCSKQCIKGP